MIDCGVFLGLPLWLGPGLGSEKFLHSRKRTRGGDGLVCH